MIISRSRINRRLSMRIGGKTAAAGNRRTEGRAGQECDSFYPQARQQERMRDPGRYRIKCRTPAAAAGSKECRMTIDIDRPYPLDDQQIAAFRRDGFIRLKNVFSADEIDYFGAEIARLTIALNTETRPIEERSTYDRAFLQVGNLWEQGGRAREFVFGRRLAALAADLLEVDGVRLYHDQSLYKEAGGGITPAHADQYYWPLSSDRSITAWVPLQPVPADMGPLAFYIGSQHISLGRSLAISDDSERQITETMQQQGLAVFETPFDLGEVSFHLGWTFHRAGANNTASPRSAMTVIYMDRDIRLAEPTNDHQRSDREKWCPGVAVGDIIASPINPILFERPA
jgi:ectoine hydroxylase-related dioxygenase (phytanoyl-CoA dioxygenase family)